MARSDDLEPLLVPDPPAALGYRQGTVVAWDPVAPHPHQVDVGGTVVENLPLLNSADSALIVPGDTVGILTFGSSWAIIGRFTVPS